MVFNTKVLVFRRLPNGNFLPTGNVLYAIIYIENYLTCQYDYTNLIRIVQCNQSWWVSYLVFKLELLMIYIRDDCAFVKRPERNNISLNFRVGNRVSNCNHIFNVMNLVNFRDLKKYLRISRDDVSDHPSLKLQLLM